MPLTTLTLYTNGFVRKSGTKKKCVVVVVFNFCMLPIKTTILKSILTLHTGFLWNIECILHISISLVIIGTMTIIYRNWDTRYTPFFRRSHLVGESYIPLHPCYVYHYEFPAVSPAMWQTKYLEKWKSGNLQPHNGDDSPIHSPWFQSKWGHDNLPRYIIITSHHSILRWFSQPIPALMVKPHIQLFQLMVSLSGHGSKPWHPTLKWAAIAGCPPKYENIWASPSHSCYSWICILPNTWWLIPLSKLGK